MCMALIYREVANSFLGVDQEINYQSSHVLNLEWNLVDFQVQSGCSEIHVSETLGFNGIYTSGFTSSISSYEVLPDSSTALSALVSAATLSSLLLEGSGLGQSVKIDDS